MMKLLLIILLIITLGCIIILDKYGKSSTHHCTTNIYYFWDGSEYKKADSQQFLISFTGEVLNAYFKLDDKEYSTKQYYKTYIKGYTVNGVCK